VERRVGERWEEGVSTELRVGRRESDYGVNVTVTDGRE
jgi:hypothetical protein